MQPSGQVANVQNDKGGTKPPGELEETRDSEADEGDEQSGESSKEADDGSNLESSEPQVEPATDSSKGEENLPGDEQDEREE